MYNFVINWKSRQSLSARQFNSIQFNSNQFKSIQWRSFMDQQFNSFKIQASKSNQINLLKLSSRHTWWWFKCSLMIVQIWWWWQHNFSIWNNFKQKHFSFVNNCNSISIHSHHHAHLNICRSSIKIETNFFSGNFLTKQMTSAIVLTILQTKKDFKFVLS